MPSFVPPPLAPVACERGSFSLPCPPLPGAQVTFLSLPGYCPVPFEPGPGSLSQLLLHCTAAAGTAVRRWQAGLALHITPVGRPAGRKRSPSVGFQRPRSGGKESPFAGLGGGRGRAGVLAACRACVVGVPCAWRAAIHLLPGCVGTGRPGRVAPQPRALTVQLSCHPIKMGCVIRLPSECHRSVEGSSAAARAPGPPVPAACEWKAARRRAGRDYGSFLPLGEAASKLLGSVRLKQRQLSARRAGGQREL